MIQALLGIFRSFFSRYFYYEVGQEWQGTGIQYIIRVAFLIALITTLFAAAITTQMDSNAQAKTITKYVFADAMISFEDGINRIIESMGQVPPLKINDQQLSFIKDSENQLPTIVEIKDPLTKRPLVVFDPKGTIKDLTETPAFYLVHDRYYLERNLDGSSLKHHYAEFFNSYPVSETSFNAFLSLFEQFPQVTLKDNRLISNSPEPTFLRLPEHQDSDNPEHVLAIVDVLSTNDSLSDYPNAWFILTGDRLIYPDGENSDQQIEVLYSEMDYVWFKEQFASFLAILKKFVYIGLFVIILPATFFSLALFMSLMMFFYSLMTFILGRTLFGFKDMPYKAAMRLTSVALTPAIILNLVLPLLIKNQGLVYFLVTLGYIYFALHSNRINVGPPTSEPTD